MSPKELPKMFPIWIKCYKICHHFGPSFAPSSLGLEWVDLWRDFKLDLSHLFYLGKFSLVFHTKCWKGAFCADYEVTHYWIYVTTEYVDPVISRMDQLQGNRIFKFLKIHGLSKWKKCSQKFIVWNMGFYIGLYIGVYAYFIVYLERNLQCIIKNITCECQSECAKCTTLLSCCEAWFQTQFLPNQNIFSEKKGNGEWKW